MAGGIFSSTTPPSLLTLLSPCLLALPYFPEQLFQNPEGKLLVGADRRPPLCTFPPDRGAGLPQVTFICAQRLLEVFGEVSRLRMGTQEFVTGSSIRTFS